ncbi:outer membrane protein assembly factor BamD [Candidatus Nesciobacter abundans]|uniref:outer membrane protein assembly factor BamD n=1 Tax=Candidatus Nesciobacter abundans TaxID=2601668 RepID=UPI0026E42622|nr:outer membrane protein assembly factor BamD [Candidatus Nesciobacter abundans]
MYFFKKSRRKINKIIKAILVALFLYTLSSSGLYDLNLEKSAAVKENKKVNQKSSDQKDKVSDLQKIWLNAEDLLKRKKYSQAAEKYLEIEENYPTSSKAKYAILKAAKSFYNAKEYEKSLEAARVLKSIFPIFSGEMDVNSIIIKCLYKKIRDVGRDNSEISEILELIPLSKSNHSEIRSKCINILAYQNFQLGIFYSKKGNPIVSLKYYGKIIKEYSKSDYVQESLFRCAEIFQNIGSKRDKERILKYFEMKYPKSKWYVEAKNLN